LTPVGDTVSYEELRNTRNLIPFKDPHMSVDIRVVKRMVHEIYPTIKALRRDLHRHPETAYEEVRTARVVSVLLKKFGIPHRTKVGKTGVVALIRGKHPGKCIAFRADMDALALEEKNRIPHRSVHPGRMHACGHDGHTANLVGVAHILSHLKEHIRGSVKLIFQPAEEGGAGAAAMLKDGAFRNPRPDVIYGLHCDTSFPVGSIAMSPGPTAAAADTFNITIRGRGTHAAYPHRGIDPIVISAEVIQTLQTIASRRTRPADPVVVTIGTIQGGSASNIIPDEVKMTGTFRTYDRKLRRVVPRQIRQIVRGVARAMGGSGDVECTFGYPPVINDRRSCEFLGRLGAELLGRKNVHPKPPEMGGEDFAFFLEETPGVMFRLGNGSACGPGHSSTFNFNDRALPTGMLVITMLALRWLEAQ
jgi:amidohydrolase